MLMDTWKDDNYAIDFNFPVNWSYYVDMARMIQELEIGPWNTICACKQLVIMINHESRDIGLMQLKIHSEMQTIYGESWVLGIRG